eukprot:TRINITY_DN2989_c2_g1_i1.p1 TRINITY_DN2989_c2_g1~~TRINITY_DN2989_c2_g1_i1.p1  ORF type:complete len:564 (+),score=114.94 TRINITY_DN2989_c2_g1_i1:123-1814(+)
MKSLFVFLSVVLFTQTVLSEVTEEEEIHVASIADLILHITGGASNSTVNESAFLQFVLDVGAASEEDSHAGHAHRRAFHVAYQSRTRRTSRRYSLRQSDDHDHDHDHDHDVDHDEHAEEEEHTCPDPEALFHAVDTDTDHVLSALEIEAALPTILMFVAECKEAAHAAECSSPSTAIRWGATFGMTVLISAIACVGLTCVPVLMRWPVSIAFLTAFAIGSLLGEVFFHIIPEIFGQHGPYAIAGGYEEPTGIAPISPLHSSIMILAGFLATFIFDRGIEILRRHMLPGAVGDILAHGSASADGPVQRPDSADAMNTPTSSTVVPMEMMSPETRAAYEKRVKPAEEAETEAEISAVTRPISEDEGTEAQTTSAVRRSSWTSAGSFGLGMNGKTVRETLRTSRSVAWMIFFSDLLHNVVDGLAIGAAFSVSVRLGVATSVAVIVHEVFQEVADFAILLGAGVPVPVALVVNFLSAVVCIAGGMVGVGASERSSDAQSYILGFSAGGFLAIAVGHLTHEMWSSFERHAAAFDSWRMKIAGTAGMVLCIVIGLVAMLLLSSVEGHSC